jgi:hypothetical protein
MIGANVSSNVWFGVWLAGGSRNVRDLILSSFWYARLFIWNAETKGSQSLVKQHSSVIVCTECIDGTCEQTRSSPWLHW